MKESLIWSTQPIFISSTFSDIYAERNVLRDRVFKTLEERLLKDASGLSGCFPLGYRNFQ